MTGGHVDAGEIIYLFSWAMKMGLPTKDIAEQIYVYPTFGNDIKFLI